MRHLAALVTTMAGLLLFGAVGEATIINGGFDASPYYMQDLTGWTAETGVLQPGSVTVKDLHISDQGTYYTPRNGSNLAVLTAGDLVVDMNGAATGYNPTLLYQTVFATAGTKIAGASAFDSLDMWTFPDYGFVRMFAGNTFGNVMPGWGGDTLSAWQLFYDQAGDPPFHDGPWTEWLWTAPITGIYTLAFGVGNVGDDPAFGGYNNSMLLVDAVQVVPEPATIILLAAGLSGLALLGRRTRAR